MFYSQEIHARQTVDNVCPKCETHFNKWTDYHAHVTTVKCARKIVPLNTSGRTKERIVADAERTWLAPSLLRMEEVK